MRLGVRDGWEARAANTAHSLLPLPLLIIPSVDELAQSFTGAWFWALVVTIPPSILVNFAYDNIMKPVRGVDNIMVISYPRALAEVVWI